MNSIYKTACGAMNSIPTQGFQSQPKDVISVVGQQHEIASLVSDLEAEAAAIRAALVGPSPESPEQGFSLGSGMLGYGDMLIARLRNLRDDVVFLRVRLT